MRMRIFVLTCCAVLSSEPGWAQGGEARCGSAGDPLRYYILSSGEGLRKFDAAEVVEISKNGQLCAADLDETRIWRATVERAREEASDFATSAILDARARAGTLRRLQGDGRALEAWAASALESTRGDVKDAISFALDLLLSEGAPAARVLEAVGQLAVSKAVGDDLLSFGASGTSLVVRGAATGKSLGVLTVKELVAQAGAEALAQAWLAPALNRIAEIGAAADADAQSKLLRLSGDLASTLVITKALARLLDRELSKISRYEELTRGSDTSVVGCWSSSDHGERFTVDCRADGWCTLTERAGSALLERRGKLQNLGGGGYRLDRDNDDTVLAFVGFQPSIRQEIVARGPRPSFLTMRRAGHRLKVEWFGLQATKDNHARLKELQQPGQLLPKSYEFVRCGSRINGEGRHTSTP